MSEYEVAEGKLICQMTGDDLRSEVKRLRCELAGIAAERDLLRQQVANLTYSNNAHREMAESWRSAAVERDLLLRQVEVLLWHIISESPNAGVCHMGQPQCYGCLGVGDCKDESECMKRLREWSLEQAKKGGE